MDLGTVLKKTKTHVYKSKAEFKADIDLIWDNCLLYNTSPVRCSFFLLRETPLIVPIPFPHETPYP